LPCGVAETIETAAVVSNATGSFIVGFLFRNRLIVI
jgi:hypothetical protein